MKQNLILCVVFFLAAGCGGNHPIFKEKLPQVVIVFKDAPNQTSEISETGSKQSILLAKNVCYVDTLMQLQEYSPAETGYDTLVIPTFNGTAELMHYYRLFDQLYYKFKAGDTIFFTYSNTKRPYAQSKLSAENTFLYNLPYTVKGALYKEGYSLAALYHPSHKIAATYRYVKSGKQIKTLDVLYRPLYVNLDSIQREYDTYVKTYEYTLDSLSKNGGISADYYEFYSRYLTIEQASQKKYAAWLQQSMKKEKSSLSQTHNDRKQYRDSLCTHLADSLLIHLDYHHKLNLVLSALSYTPAKRDLDYTLGFSEIEQDTILPPITKQMLLKMAAEKITCGWPYPQLPENVKYKYSLKYASITGDSSFLYAARNILALAQNSVNDLVVRDVNNNRMNFTDVLQRHKGKIIYIDLWASWCAPCVSLMPASHALREKYIHKDVVFLYLALNDREQEWRKAIKEYQLENAENYFIENGKDSKFLASLAMKGIPWFLLYDKTGTLVNCNAPRPSSGKEIEEAFLSNK